MIFLFSTILLLVSARSGYLSLILSTAEDDCHRERISPGPRLQQLGRDRDFVITP